MFWLVDKLILAAFLLKILPASGGSDSGGWVRLSQVEVESGWVRLSQVEWGWVPMGPMAPMGPRSQPNGIPGRLGLAAMGHSSDFLNVMWLARRGQRGWAMSKAIILRANPLEWSSMFTNVLYVLNTNKCACTCICICVYVHVYAYAYVYAYVCI